MSSKAPSGKEDRARARWAILRNALLQRDPQNSSTLIDHSIHRFPGYRLLKRRPFNAAKLSQKLRVFCWEDDLSHESNLAKLLITCLAVAAAFPKGQQIIVDGAPACDFWIDELTEKCNSCLSIIASEASGSTHLLLQEKKESSKYSIYEYVFDDQCKLLTREPRENRLSVHDLVSHRKTGVDNTGNFCVWDSERTLAFLLFHHLEYFGLLELRAATKITELGTGMAGLSAIALGLRLQLNKTNAVDKKIEVTLTDGHPDGVLNNQVNRFLTTLSIDSESNSPYFGVSVSEKVLLWSVDAKRSDEEPQDLVLVSDCIHFQNFHAALAITTLRVLHLGGKAIFCQPARADSLINFFELLRICPDLSSLQWLEHPILQDCCARAKLEFKASYDESLHKPQLLIIQKLRDLSQKDCDAFVAHQLSRKVKK